MSLQNIRYTSFMPASENDHSNFRISTLSLPTGSLAVIKRGVYKSHYSYFIANYIQFEVTFPWPAEFDLNSIPVGWEGGGQWLQITDVCINDTVIFLSFCRYILTSEEDIRWESGISSGERG